MSARWQCWIGWHTPPDPATPRDRQYYQSASFDCGYPPYKWRCRVCGKLYGRHSTLPPMDAGR